MQRHVRRADAYLLAGKNTEAAASLQTALEIQPDHVPTLLQLTELHLQSAHHNEARELIFKALAGNIGSPRVALQLVMQLASIGESGLMLDIAKQLHPAMWDSAKSLAEMSQQLSLVGAHHLADAFAVAAVSRDPMHPPSLYMLATMDVFYGRMDSAAENAERCIEMLPDDPNVHWLISRLKLPAAGKRIDRIEKALAKSPGADAESWLGYALHNELHDQRDYERSWQALERACKAKRSLLNFDRREVSLLFQSLRQWSPAHVQPAAAGFVDPGFTPIFVIGLHRSGTTLAERIVSGHSMVAAGGETYDVTSALHRATGIHFRGELHRCVLEREATFDYRRIGWEYLKGMQWRAKGKQFVTDKLPSNYMNVGFIAKALPSAKFICLRRNPIDVGLSNLRTLFGDACPHSYDQIEFAEHYHHFNGLMDHWCESFSGRILNVAYDDMVNTPELTTQSIARFCGLEYQPAMVRIESRNDAVATASSVMLRDGIRKDRGEVWKVYERHLQPMIQALAG